MLFARSAASGPLCRVNLAQVSIGYPLRRACTKARVREARRASTDIRLAAKRNSPGKAGRIERETSAMLADGDVVIGGEDRGLSGLEDRLGLRHGAGSLEIA